MVRSRYAPSPTGYMTIGNLRSALYEYLTAKHEDGVFILRLEDTDRNRYVEGAENVIYDTLRQMGLKYDEGPGVGGDYGPYIQSERVNDYLPRAQELIKKGAAYYCFCPKERLDGLTDAHGVTRYDRHCFHSTPAETEQKLADGEPYVIRQLIPEGKTTFHDEVYGDITIDNGEMEDQILLKSDGMPTYNFANVVDDHAMRITHVVRGCEYLTSTPKYKLLYEAFGWDVPVFIHLPLMVNEQGQKISKRHGDASVQDLLSEGYLPSAIVNYTALLGWSPRDNREIFTLEELTRAFDPKYISKSPSILDLKKLAWVNGEHIKRLPFETFYETALPVLKDAVKTPGVDCRKLARMTQSRVQFVKECAGLVDFIDKLPDYDVELYTHKKMKTTPEIALNALELIIADLKEINETEWLNDALYEAASRCAEAHGLARSQVLWPVRTALSGKPASPCGATELCELLGKTETLNRLNAAVLKIKQSEQA